MNPDQERVKKLLHDTVLMLCKSGLKYQEQLEIKGVIGITIDKKDVIIVHIKDVHMQNESGSESTQVTSCTATEVGQSTPSKRIKVENFSDYQSYGEATPTTDHNIQSQNSASSVLFFTDDLDNQSSLSSSQVSNTDIKSNQWALAIPQPKAQTLTNNSMNMNNNESNSFFGSTNNFMNMNQPARMNSMQQQQKPNINQLMRQQPPTMQTPQKQMALMALTPRKSTPKKQQLFQLQQQSPFQQQPQQRPQQQFQLQMQQYEQPQEIMSPPSQTRGRPRGSRGGNIISRGRARGRGRASALGDNMGMMMMGRGGSGGGKISVENKTIDDFSYDKETITHYKCKLCGMSYTSHSSLLTHQVKSHGRQKKAGVGRKPKNFNESFEEENPGFSGGVGEGDGYDDYGESYDYDGDYYP